MLLNNFRPLLSFYPSGTFKDVLGNTVNKADVLAGQVNQDVKNNHTVVGSTLSYDYATNTDSNNFTDEQTSYDWSNVISSSTDSSIRQSGFTMFVGSGNTAVTRLDYKLDSPLILDVLNATCTHNQDETTTVQRTFQNNTISSVTVKEVGCYLFTYCYSTTNPLIMIARTVLETPITIADGEKYTFTYEIDLSNIILG